MAMAVAGGGWPAGSVNATETGRNSNATDRPVTQYMHGPTPLLAVTKGYSAFSLSHVFCKLTVVQLKPHAIMNLVIFQAYVVFVYVVPFLGKISG